jgi:hypothetical protein
MVLEDNIQIEVLESVREDIIDRSTLRQYIQECRKDIPSVTALAGLCALIKSALRRKSFEYEIKLCGRLEEYIPLFTYENAVEHANGKIIGIDSERDFWWDHPENNKKGYYDEGNRIKFLDWMINELKRENKGA